MPVVRIPEDGLEIEVRQGESLPDICDREITSILFSCFSARCGICRIRVLGGRDGLSEVTDMERQLIGEAVLANERLACQCRVVSDVTIETVPQM